MSLTIRQSRADDADSIGRLAAEFHSYLRALGDETEFDWGAAKYARDGFGEHPAFEGLVAEVDSLIIGYALYHFGYDADRGQRLVHLIDLHVSPPFRRSGIGERLMRRLTEIGRSQRAEYMLWSALKTNALAIRFYEKQGAQHVEHVQFMWRPIQS
jgi:ribosomal protein S18 acetylase RimI-like enzyme